MVLPPLLRVNLTMVVVNPNPHLWNKLLKLCASISSSFSDTVDSVEQGLQPGLPEPHVGVLSLHCCSLGKEKQKS